MEKEIKTSLRYVLTAPTQAGLKLPPLLKTFWETLYERIIYMHNDVLINKLCTVKGVISVNTVLPKMCW